MKIVQSIQNLYNDHYVFYDILKKHSDEILMLNKKPEWHYVSRLKKIESFAMKIETGRFNKDEIFEDFFASTIVVQNLSEINIAIQFIITYFDVKFKRPQNQNFTHKDSFSFPFDDLRLYLSLKDPGTGKLASKIYDLVFELQIKTFLQHAWGIATHDLIYKSSKINWSKERIAYQVKATLEHAEVSISGVEELSKVTEISKENKEVKQINLMITMLSKHWDDVDLPADRRRLAQNIISLITALGISLKDLNKIITEESSQGRGAKIRDLSPYLIIVQSLYHNKNTEFLKYLRSKNGKQKILIAKELNLPKLSRIIKEKIINID
ncbi:hypothetical protein [Flavobacterium sp. FlaQc-28]|uniref:hypothetical protein n=1 Tax=Flavobacterium sp. FlaQc-28 TaxID=3374178 RepID=UPI0037574B91